MMKEVAEREGGDGELLSELHALARLGIRNSAVESRMTEPLSTAETCGTSFLERFSRSSLTQFDRHDCDTNIGLIASTPGWFIAE